ncbi:MAG: hypothetical protein OJF59_003156 [Cytophagales bacterium]|jgi:hypothetical protein|nr:hypothetical protein [Bacteroidota bacterium]MBS1981950.1 hypothetical protein [Bacteroidota bacterium]WHZ09400.1 MAG: hypothetical protein OJF59_003156 [Cytophagales bacterium]
MKTKIFGILLFLMTSSVVSSAQCAMCRATLENNISNGNIGIARGINFGILYLFVAPYLFFTLIAFFWYRTSKRNAQSV